MQTGCGGGEQLADVVERAGTSRGTRTGAWIVSRSDGDGEVVAEGPVLGMLVNSGGKTGKIPRPAMSAERSPGEVAGTTGPP
jgi:hypothetical protein